MKKFYIKAFIPLAALVAGITISTGIITSANIKENKPSSGKMYVDGVEIKHTDFNYPVNKNGQTYGSCADAVYIEDHPDLVSVVGNDGKVGYIYKEDMLGEDPSCPEEAVKMMEERKKAEENGTYTPKVCNVYASDGETIIDTFTIG
ncbi:MAG: hypothetical protein J6B01_08490 [Ruminococcus sp.]|nr:hypothetical protein [Ruminococcus sp.]MBR3760721.1 hypothetical protein [Ruminococcus sp.]